MNTLKLEPVPGKPGVFTTTLDGAPAVVAYRKEQFDAHEKFSTVRFALEHIRYAKSVAAKRNLPVYLAVEVEVGGKLWVSYAMRAEICPRFFPRWAFPLGQIARRVFDAEPEVIKGFRADVLEGVAA